MPKRSHDPASEGLRPAPCPQSLMFAMKGSYMAECHAFSQELLFVLWWCRQDDFRQFFIIGSRFSRKDCNYFK